MEPMAAKGAGGFPSGRRQAGRFRRGGCAFSSRRGWEEGIGHVVCGRGVGELYSRWPGCPTCWLVDRSCGCVVVLGSLSSALRASVGWCRKGHLLYLIPLIFQRNLSCVFCIHWTRRWKIVNAWSVYVLSMAFEKVSPCLSIFSVHVLLFWV